MIEYNEAIRPGHIVRFFEGEDQLGSVTKVAGDRATVKAFHKHGFTGDEIGGEEEVWVSLRDLWIA